MSKAIVHITLARARPSMVAVVARARTVFTKARTVVVRAFLVVVVVRLGLGQWLLEHSLW